MEPPIDNYMRCPTCNGTGYLREAVQAWDIPGAPEVPCSECKGDGWIPWSVPPQQQEQAKGGE